MVAIRNCKFLLAVTGWADSEGNEHSSRSCKIAALGIGGKGMASPGGGRPLRDCPLHRSLVQLMAGKYHDIEIMLDYEQGRTIRLGEITPEWWIK